jgi:hypothetical protein
MQRSINRSSIIACFPEGKPKQSPYKAVRRCSPQAGYNTFIDIIEVIRMPHINDLPSDSQFGILPAIACGRAGRFLGLFGLRGMIAHQVWGCKGVFSVQRTAGSGQMTEDREMSNIQYPMSNDELKTESSPICDLIADS